MYNYADDNTICCRGSNVNDIKTNIECQTEIFIQWYHKNYMKVNAEKFQAIIFGINNGNEVSFMIDNNDIMAQKEAKLLGVTFDNKLLFDTHISDICRKAGKQLSVLKRMSNVLNRDGKQLLYNTFIFSNFNYCSLIWHFCTMSGTRKIEKIQERSLRYVFNDFTSTYHELLSLSNRSVLYVNRLRVMLQYVYKVINNNVPTYLNDMFEVEENIHNTRCFMRIKQHKFKTIKHGFNSISHQGAQLWNMLPTVFKDYKSYIHFIQCKT